MSPFSEKPTVTSGLRLGASAGTTGGFGAAEFRRIGELVADVLDALAANLADNSAAEAAAMESVRDLTRRFPIYPS